MVFQLPKYPNQPLSVRVEVAGIAVDNLSEGETVEAIQRLIAGGGQHYGAVVNAAKVSLAHRDPDLASVLKCADLVTADGMSVVWASRLLGLGLKGRVTGIDLMCRVIEQAERVGYSIYFLGAREKSVHGTAEYFRSQCPRLRVGGYRNGYFPSADSGQIANEIRQSGADILFVAMGSPAQELWIQANLAATGARFALGVGGSFDHLSGLVQRAPTWMQRAGLEWLYRLGSEPRRLWRRYLIGNSVFLWLVVKQLFSPNRSKSGLSSTP
jgi:N-acetylglucosaminyldiphosphoundecaprenol N-acetyl-beta-D-mannosaminyltransferase